MSRHDCHRSNYSSETYVFLFSHKKRLFLFFKSPPQRVVTCDINRESDSSYVIWFGPDTGFGLTWFGPDTGFGLTWFGPDTGFGLTWFGPDTGFGLTWR